VAAGILGGGSSGRIGMAGSAAARGRFEAILADLQVTREQLQEIARLAREGVLMRQDKHPVVDLGMLAPQSGDVTVFASWLNAARSAIQKRERASKLATQQTLGLPENDSARAPPATAPPVKAEALRAGLAFGARSHAG
jgi:hypothetical protein